MNAEFIDRLAQGLSAMGVPYRAPMLETLARFQEKLLAANARMNLTRVGAEACEAVAATIWIRSRRWRGGFCKARRPRWTWAAAQASRASPCACSWARKPALCWWIRWASAWPF